MQRVGNQLGHTPNAHLTISPTTHTLSYLQREGAQLFLRARRVTHGEHARHRGKDRVDSRAHRLEGRYTASACLMATRRPGDQATRLQGACSPPAHQPTSSPGGFGRRPTGPRLPAYFWPGAQCRRSRLVYAIELVADPLKRRAHLSRLRQDKPQRPG